MLESHKARFKLEALPVVTDTALFRTSTVSTLCFTTPQVVEVELPPPTPEEGEGSAAR